MIPKLSLFYYKENCPFGADFSTNAYMFAFSIVPKYMGIFLFPSINPVFSAKKYLKKHSKH